MKKFENNWSLIELALKCFETFEHIRRLKINKGVLFPISEPCEKTYCAWGATCVVSESGKAMCQCPADCPSTSEPVCGSDDVTYTNYCHLRQTSCLKRKNTRVKHQGACGECAQSQRLPEKYYRPGKKKKKNDEARK